MPPIKEALKPLYLYGLCLKHGVGILDMKMGINVRAIQHLIYPTVQFVVANVGNTSVSGFLQLREPQTLISAPRPEPLRKLIDWLPS